MLLTPKPGLVVPDCCEAVQKSLAIVLMYDYRDLSDEPSIIRDAPEGLDWGGTPENNFVSSMQRWLDEQPEEARKATRFSTARPAWRGGIAIDFSRGYRYHGDDWGKGRPRVPEFCPFCATKLPDIERRPEDELPGKVHTPEADGGYCGTCDERSMACECWLPSVLWRTVPPQEARP